MTGLDDMLAELMAVAGISLHAGDTPPDGGNSGDSAPDPAGRYTVKALRGGIPDAPIVRHVGFGQCPAGRACSCPPVRTEGWADAHAGIRVRGLQASKRTLPRGDLRTTDGSTGTSLTVAKRAPLYVETAADLTLDPLPELERLPDPLPKDLRDAAAQATSLAPFSQDTHSLCRTEQSKLHTRTVRAEHKLARANAEIERLKAEIAALKAPASARKQRKPKKA